MWMEKLGPDGGHRLLEVGGLLQYMKTFLSIDWNYIYRSTCSSMSEKEM